MDTFISLLANIMNIYYQGIKGSYSHQVANIVANKLNIEEKYTIGQFSFKDIFENVIKYNGIGIIPIENSYAGTVHQSLYLMKNYPIKIVGEYYLEINHVLAGLTNNLQDIKQVYSHSQALMQCENFINKYGLLPKQFSDTAGAAKYVAESGDITIGAICSKYAANLYGLNILQENINDQKGNTTRFLIIVKKNVNINLSNNIYKGTLLFKVKDQPAILFKCLGAFATRFVNLTKIESIPTQDKKFEYMFWIDYILPDSDQIIFQIIEELKCFTTEIIDLDKYGLV